MSETKTQENTNKWSERELGALWRVDGKNQSFYSGNIKVNGQEVKIVCFPNKNKEPSSNQPDIRIYQSEER
jgi:uncharacterized protein (DUF736 family)